MNDLKQKLWLRRQAILAECPREVAREQNTEEMVALDREAISHCVDDRIARGWAPEDVLAYAINLEHVNPVLEEDVALKRMAEVSKKYPPIKKRG